MSKLIGDEIRVVVVHGPRNDGLVLDTEYTFLVGSKIIRPKERFFEKLMGFSQPRTERVHLGSVFPGHSMYALADTFPKQDQFPIKWRRWNLVGLGDTFFGNAVIYGVQKGLPVPATVTVEEVSRALQMVPLQA